MSDISTKKVMMAMATMALLPWKCPIYRGRKSTLQVPNMHKGQVSTNITLLGGEREGGGLGLGGGKGDQVCKFGNMHKGQMSTNVLGGEREGGEFEAGGGKGDQACKLHKGQVSAYVIFVRDPSETLRNIRENFVIVERKMSC